MARKIIWTEPALSDLETIADFIALDKPAAARLLVQKVFEKVALLARFPNLGTIPPEIRDMPYRQLILPPCRLFYRVQRSSLFIVAVIRGERKLTPEMIER